MKTLFSLLSLLCVLCANAQIQQNANKVDPVKWETSIKKNTDQLYQLIFEADIKEDWHIYSQHTPVGGPLPMRFEFEKNDKYTLIDSVTESESERKFNETFGVDEVYFSDSARFTQKVKFNSDSKAVVKLIMSYQVCKEVCYNQELYFAFDFYKMEVKRFDNFDNYKKYGGSAAASTQDKNSGDGDGSPKDGTDGEVELENNPEEDRSNWQIFLLAFAGGFAALLTPCVFPMIPMTVSFFTKQSKTRAKGIRNAFIYGISIIVIYVILGTIVTWIFGADSLNALSTNVTFNIIFFLLLIFFAASFLGAFEIVLPASWTNKVDKQADKGGIIGIFFMALALAIVSFSCTGPIVGSVIVKAASEGGLSPIIGMLGFSLALAIPFALFAMFPGWMNSLPKSGGWLNTVKVFLGFLELAFAFKFLSNADLVLQAHFLEREVFLAIWIAVFGALAFYLFGKISLPHDSPIQHISVGRLGLALLTIAFTIYMIPGLWGAPLKLISGFPPPMNYSESPMGVGYTGGSSTENTQEIPEHASYGPHQLITFHNYQHGIEYAQKENLPIFLDFTGHACVNCRKMEERVWAEPKILSKLRNDFVIISLYVDEKKSLPKDEQYISEETGKRIRSVGNKWSDLQMKDYETNAQPYYVLLSPEEKLLTQPVGYTPDAEEFNNWLKKGLEKFKK